MAEANMNMPDLNVPGAAPQALQAANGAAVVGIPNQANWAAMNQPNWRRTGRLTRTPGGFWTRVGRLYSV